MERRISITFIFPRLPPRVALLKTDEKHLEKEISFAIRVHKIKHNPGLRDVTSQIASDAHAL